MSFSKKSEKSPLLVKEASVADIAETKYLVQDRLSKLTKNLA